MKPTEEQEQFARKSLEEMCALLGMAVEVQVASTEKFPESVTLRVVTEDAGKIIGRHGETISALELLLNRIVRKGGALFPPVRIGVQRTGGANGDEWERSPAMGRGRPRRDSAVPRVDEARFRALALDAAKEVRKWGDPKVLGPFTAAQRRVIHLALRDVPDIETVSGAEEADGRKKVVVQLCRPPEDAGETAAPDND